MIPEYDRSVDDLTQIVRKPSVLNRAAASISKIRLPDPQVPGIHLGGLKLIAGDGYDNAY
jgi:hypothetical protein